MRPVAWREALWMWALIAVAAALLLVVFYDGLKPMAECWSGREEYSYGFALPLVAGFFVWQKNPLLERMHFEGSWTGLLIVLSGIALYFAGELRWPKDSCMISKAGRSSWPAPRYS
jgi:hypothetical protein